MKNDPEAAFITNEDLQNFEERKTVLGLDEVHPENCFSIDDLLIASELIQTILSHPN